MMCRIILNYFYRLMILSIIGYSFFTRAQENDFKNYLNDYAHPNYFYAQQILDIPEQYALKEEELRIFLNSNKNQFFFPESAYQFYKNLELEYQDVYQEVFFFEVNNDQFFMTVDENICTNTLNDRAHRFISLIKDAIQSLKKRELLLIFTGTNHAIDYFIRSNMDSAYQTDANIFYVSESLYENNNSNLNFEKKNLYKRLEQNANFSKQTSLFLQLLNHSAVSYANNNYTISNENSFFVTHSFFERISCWKFLNYPTISDKLYKNSKNNAEIRDVGTALIFSDVHGFDKVKHLLALPTPEELKKNNIKKVKVMVENLFDGSYDNNKLTLMYAQDIAEINRHIKQLSMDSTQFPLLVERMQEDSLGKPLENIDQLSALITKIAEYAKDPDIDFEIHPLQ